MIPKCCKKPMELKAVRGAGAVQTTNQMSLYIRVMYYFQCKKCGKTYKEVKRE